VARFHYGVAGLIAGGAFDSLRRIRGVHVPLLVAHGDEDEVVPYGLGEALFAAAGESKRFIQLPGAHHNDVLENPALLDAIADFARTAAASR
jgi:pimeloyl-ACP methyl ester carboxylesterase